MKAVIKSDYCKQQGVALIEVLIAFFVLSIGLLGLAGLQMKTLQYNQSSFQQSQAMVAAYDMLDRMRLNRSAATGKIYDTDWISTHAGGSELAKQDVAAWISAVHGNLPDGQGKIECDANIICTVSVRWTSRFNTQDGDDEYESVSLTSQF